MSVMVNKRNSGTRFSANVSYIGEPVSPNSQLIKIAHLYYIENMGQRAIADRMNISIASVSRAIAKARELKIVRISIDGGANDFSELEIEMERRFSLRECILVPSFETSEQTYRQMAVAAADLLARLLKPGDVVGVSWGETMKAIGEAMPRLPVGRVDVVPIIGAMGTIETGIYPNSIARTFAEKLGGDAYLVNTPALVDSVEVRDSLMADSNFQPVRDLWSHLEMAILGVSGLDTNTSMYRGGIFSELEMAQMRQDGSECASNFILFDANGKAVHTSITDRLVCLPLESLKRIPHVLLMAEGLAKAAPLRAMLNSGICTTLITDADCANAILKTA